MITCQCQYFLVYTYSLFIRCCLSRMHQWLHSATSRELISTNERPPFQGTCTLTCLSKVLFNIVRLNCKLVDQSQRCVRSRVSNAANWRRTLSPCDALLQRISGEYYCADRSQIERSSSAIGPASGLIFLPAQSM